VFRDGPRETKWKITQYLNYTAITSFRQYRISVIVSLMFHGVRVSPVDGGHDGKQFQKVLL